MEQNLLLSIVLLLCAFNFSDGETEASSGCPGLRPIKRIVCYLEVRGSTIPPMDPCYCTHLILTTPLAKLSSDSEVMSTLSVMRKRNPDLQVMGLASDPAETVLKRRDAYVKALMSVVRKTGLDGVELDLTWFTKISRKDKFFELVKSLYKEMKQLHGQTNNHDNNNNRKKRESEHNLATKYSSSEEEEEDLEMTGSDEEEYVTEKVLKDPVTSPQTNDKEKEDVNTEEEDDVSDDIGKFVISVRLPNEPQYLAKNFDLKRLSKYVNFFTISSENVTDASETGMTYHPSRLMGIEDILNSDSLVDLITGLGAPHPKLVLSLPGFALRFTLSDQNKNMPLSPVTTKPRRISQAEVCALMSEGKWTLERDEDLTAPYAFSNDTWLAFDDKISASIKGKYILLRDLGGASIVTLDYIDWSGKCDKHVQQSENNSGKNGQNDTIASAMAILPALFDSFTNTARKSRAAQLVSLQEELHQFSPYSFSADVQLSPYRIVRVIDRAGSIHVVRKEAKTEFECSRQGYFRHPSGCNRFYRCVKFNQYSPDYTVFEYDCPAGLAFDEKYEVCVWPGSLEDGGACQGSSEIAPVPRERYVCPRVEGYYADPENCRWFFACYDHVRDGVTPLTAYEFRCPFGLVFNEQLLLCDWPWNVPSCGGAGAFRAKFTVGDLLEGRARASYATLPDYQVSGGRIENAGGVVLGSSIIPGVVHGGAYHGAYSSDSGLKYSLGAGEHHGQFGSGGAYSGYGSGGTVFKSGSAGHALGAGEHHGQFGSGGAYSGYGSGGTVFKSGSAGHALGAGEHHGQFGSGGAYSGYGSGGTVFKSGSAGHALSAGELHGQFGSGGAYSGYGSGSTVFKSGSAGHALGAGEHYGQFGSGGAYSGYGSGGTVFNSGSAGHTSAGGYHLSGGEHSGSEYQAGAGAGAGAKGSYSGGYGLHEGGRYSGDNGFHQGDKFSGGYGLHEGGKYSGASGFDAGNGVSGFGYGSVNQYSSGAIESGAKVEGESAASHAQDGIGAHIGASEGNQYNIGYSAGLNSHSQEHAFYQGNSGIESAYDSRFQQGHDSRFQQGHDSRLQQGQAHNSFEAGAFGAGKAFSSGTVSSTIAPVVTPIVTHDGSSSFEFQNHQEHEHELASLANKDVGAGYFSSTIPPSIVTQSHVPVSPVTVTTSGPPLKPVQYYGSHSSSGIVHEAPLSYVSTTPSPATVSQYVPVAPSVDLHEVVHSDHEKYHAVTLPPLKPVSFLSGVSYRKPIIPLQSTVAPPLIPVSSVEPVRHNYYPQVQPVSSVSYKEHNEGYQYAKPFAFVSSPPPPPPSSAIFSVSSPAPPVTPVNVEHHELRGYDFSKPSTAVPSPEYYSVSTPAPPIKFAYSPKPVIVDHPKPVVPTVSSSPAPAIYSISTPAPPLKFNYHQPNLPEIHVKEEYGGYEYIKPGFQVSTIAPPPSRVPASPPKFSYYPRPQPVIPINHKPEGESYIYSRPVVPALPVSTPAPLVSISTPAPTVAPVNYAYYPKPQPVIPINHKPESESYVYSKPPTVTVSTTPAPSVLPLVSTPASYQQAYSIEDHGYHYAKPAIEFSYPKQQLDVFKSIVKVPVAPVTPSPPPLIVSSTPAYNSIKFGYEHRPFAFKSSTVAANIVSSTPLPPPVNVVHYPSPAPTPIPIEHQNIEVGYTFAKDSGYQYPRPVAALPQPAYVHEKHYYQPPPPSPQPPIKYNFVSTTPAPLPTVGVTFEKKLLPAVPQPVVHRYEEQKAYNYKDYGYAYQQPSIAPALIDTGYKYEQPTIIKTQVPVSLPPKNYYNIAPVSSVKFGVAYEKPVAPIISSTAAPPPPPPPPPTPIVHYSTTVSPPPSIKPINVVDYSYSYPKAVPSIIPPIHVSSTPLPPLNPIQYTYKRPVAPVSYHSTSYPEFVSTTPAPLPKVSFSTFAPPPASYVPVVSKAPTFPSDFIPPPAQPPQTYLPSVYKYSTPAPFKPAGFSTLGPKYKLIQSSTPLPVPVAPIRPVSFEYAYNKPEYYSTPAPVHVNAPIVTPIHPTTAAPPPPPVYIKTQTVIPAPAPTPIVPMYQQVFDAFKAPVVTAYEKVLNVLKTSTPAAQPVYVNHYTSSTPLPPVAVTTLKPASPVVPHHFHAGGIEDAYRYEGENLYESLRNEYGSKLSSYEGGYNYQKPAIAFEGDGHYNAAKHAQGQKVTYSSTAFTPTVSPKKVYRPTTTYAPPHYVDYNDYNSFSGGKYEHESGGAFYSSTPSPPVYQPAVQQFLKEVVYPKPTVSTAGYEHSDLQFYSTPSTTTILPPVTTARVSLPVIKHPAAGCIDCGISKSQNLRVKQPPLPVSYTTSTPVPLVVSTPLISTTPLIHSRLPTTITTPAVHYEEEIDEALDVVNQEEEEGANILAGYQQSGQFGGILSQSVGLKGVTSVQGLSSTTVSSLRDGEAIVGVIKKEKNVYTGRQDKAKVVVVSRLSDFNPILVGKLGAECSCKSDPVSLRRRGKGKYNHQTKSYELFVPNDISPAYEPSYTSTTLSTPLAPIIVPDTQSNGEYGYSSNNHEEYSSFVEIKPQAHQILRTTVSPAPSFIPSSSPETIYSSSESYIEEPVSSTVTYEEIPSVVPLVKTKKVLSAVRHKPVYAKSLQPTYQEVLVPTIPAQTIADLDAQAKVAPGKSFDRYGPGGWRGADETLQGSVDCKRAGLFRHPKYCNKFYACNWDSWKKRFTLHVFNCPVHLAYDQQIGACNWPSKGPACSDDNLLV